MHALYETRAEAERAIDACDVQLATIANLAAAVKADAERRLASLEKMREETLDLRRRACVVLVDLGTAPADAEGSAA